MPTLYTDYVKKKYKKKNYYIRGWLSYTLKETATTKSITFTAGFQTKKRKCSTKAIKMEVLDSFGNKKSGSKKWNGSSATSSIRFVDSTTWTWKKTTANQNIRLNIIGTFGSTRWSGLKAVATLPIIIPALSRPQVSFVATRQDDTTAKLSLTVTPNGRTISVTQPSITRVSEAISPSWTVNGSPVTFPVNISAATVFEATDTVDPLHSFDYSYSGNAGAYSYEDGSSIDYVYRAEWQPTAQQTEEGENAIIVSGEPPDINYLGNADINVYAYDYRKGEFTLLPNEDGWEIEIIDATHWKLPISLKEQYVQSGTSVSTTAKIKVQYKKTAAVDLIDNLAIFNTNRNANFSTGLANNVFIGGCTMTDFSSRVWYSAVNNPLYIPDTNYIEVGSNDTRVMGLVKVGDYLGVIKQSKSVDSSVFLVYPTSFDNETTFATKACVSGVGALGQYCFNVLGDETLFLSPRGIMAIEPSEDEASRVQDRSYYVNGRLLEEIGLEKAYSFVWNGLYLLAVNNHVYVLDGSQRNSWGNKKTNLVYECYFLDNVPAKIMFSYDGDLWFADFEGNVCRFKKPTDDDPYKDEDDNVEAVWSTIADDDGSIQFYKNLSKKGTLISLLPEEGTTARVYLKKDEEDEMLITEANPIEAGTRLPPSVYTKKKVKKYKRLQIIIEDRSDAPFGLNKIVKSYTLGNYAKK